MIAGGKIGTPPWPQPTDIEQLVQWALAETGYLPWRNPTDEDLAMDHGLDVIPKGTRALYRPSGGIALKVRGGMPFDANRVIEAIKSLDAATASQIIACGKEKIRPNCLAGVEPRQVLKTIGWRKAAKRRKGRKTNRKPVQVWVWEPVEPQAICAARAAYTRWHDGMTALVGMLKDQLTHWRITGFGAPRGPWKQALEKIS